MKRYILIALAALALAACEKNPEEENSTPKDCNLHGYAQKGQFVKGSQVTAFAVGKDLVPTGESFPANISDDLGAFAISGKTAAPFFELRAEGYYFNEMDGQVSRNPLYLEALVKSNDNAANVNLMTTAIKLRVKKLIKDGKNYDEAISQAQAELLKAIGFSDSAVNFDDMDITGTSDADGMLLAFACMVQKNRLASEVTTLIQEIASDLESKGELGATVLGKLKANVADINPFHVIENLANYYWEKNLPISTIPIFYKYLDSRYNQPFMFSGLSEMNSQPIAEPGGSSINNESGPYESCLEVLSTIHFTVEMDVQGATLEKKQILGPAYRVSFMVPANEEVNEREFNVIFKDDSGQELARRSYKQGGNAQYLIITGMASTKSALTVSDGGEGNPFIEGAEVSVNGSVCTLKPYEQLHGDLGVVVPISNQYVVSYPANAATIGEHIAKVKTTIAAVNEGPMVLPYYAIRVGSEDFPIQNPTVINMKPCLASLEFPVAEAIASKWAYAEVEANKENVYLSGTASFLLNESDQAYYSDLNPNIVFENDKTNKVRINRYGDGAVLTCHTFPQKLSNGVTATLFDENDEIVGRLEIGTVEVRVGYKYAFPAIGKYTDPIKMIPHWLELPEINTASLRAGTQAFVKHWLWSNINWRNYSLLWNYDDYVSQWVAYPLNSDWAGSGAQSYGWSYDDSLPAEVQPDITRQYGGDWVRGHLMSPDHRRNENDNITAYYATNVAPMDEVFNSKIWSRLQSKIVQWSNECDTLYVVTGCLFEGNDRTPANTGVNVRIPTAFWKAWMQDANHGYHMGAIILDNNSTAGNQNFNRNMLIPVSELETRIGFKLFVNLEEQIGEYIANLKRQEDPTNSVFF